MDNRYVLLKKMTLSPYLQSKIALMGKDYWLKVSITPQSKGVALFAPPPVMKS
jgi:hypothetical protein